MSCILSIERTYISYGCINSTNCTNGLQLRENNAPGASLNGRDLNLLKVPHIKRCLECRSTSTIEKRLNSCLGSYIRQLQRLDKCFYNF